jgi:hypothetical protein
MDYKFIILAIIGIIIAYVIYIYWYKLPGTSLINSTIYLNNTTTPVTFNTLMDSNFISDSPTFYAWIYVNSPTTNNLAAASLSSVSALHNFAIGSGSLTPSNVLFYMNSIGGNAASPIENNDCLYAWALDNKGENLYVVYNTGSQELSPGSACSGNGQIIKVASNIPIQTWIFVTIVLDNTTTTPIMDIYMNGKLTTSKILSDVAADKYQHPVLPTGLKSSAGIVSSPPKLNVIKFGSRQDVYISNLTIQAGILTPQQVQTAYMSFSSKQNSVANAKTHYGVSLTRGDGTNKLSNDFQMW